MSIQVISTPPTQFTLPPNQALTVENLGPGYVHWGRFPVDDSHNEGIIQPSNTLTFYAPFGPTIYLACDTPTSVSTTFVPFPNAAAMLGSDGYVGGSGGSPLTPSVVSVGSIAPGTGGTGDWFLVRSDGTIQRFTPPEISVDAWQAVGNGTTVDSTAFNNAVSQANTNGGGIVRLTPGKTYKIGQVAPLSGVTVVGYGASVKVDTGQTQACFYTTSTGVSGFVLKGITFAGTGSETQEQQCLVIPGATDVTVQDCKVNNWHTGCFYFKDCTRAKAIDNTIETCCVASGYNAINFVATTAPVTDVEARGNIVEGCQTIPIAYVQSATVTGGSIKVDFTDNICQAVGAGVAMGLEFSATTPGAAYDVVVEGNILTQTGTNYGLYQTLPAAATDPTLIQRFSFKGNTINSAGQGIFAQASDMTIEGNVVKCAKNALSLTLTGTYTGITGTSTNASTSITSVSGAPAGVANGMPISGTNIAKGTYLVSGAGTATWTISKAATGANSGLTVYPQLTNVTVKGNLFHCSQNPAGPVASINQVRESTIEGNRFTTDAGSTSAFNGVDFTFASFIDFEGNKIMRAAHHGLTFTNCDNLKTSENRVYNPAEAGSASHGIFFNGTSGQQICDANLIVDDRASHVMDYGIFSLDAGYPTNGNIISGAATAATNNTTTTAGV